MKHASHVHVIGLLLIYGVFDHMQINAQDLLKDRAVTEVIAYQARTLDDIGDFIVNADVVIKSTPDSIADFESRYQYDQLVYPSEKLRWQRLIKSSQSASGEEKTSHELACTKEHLWKGDQMFKRMSLGNWVKTTEERSRSFCHFHTILDWPFLIDSTLTESEESGIMPFQNKKCSLAKEVKEGLLAEWVRPDGKGFGKLYTIFREGVPVQFKMIAFTEPVGNRETDVSKGRVLSQVETSWKDLGEYKLPVKVSAITASLETGDRELIVLVDAKFDWKLGKDIPQKLIHELNEIAETTK